MVATCGWILSPFCFCLVLYIDLHIHMFTCFRSSVHSLSEKECELCLWYSYTRALQTNCWLTDQNNQEQNLADLTNEYIEPIILSLLLSLLPSTLQVALNSFSCFHPLGSGELLEHLGCPAYHYSDQWGRSRHEIMITIYKHVNSTKFHSRSSRLSATGRHGSHSLSDKGWTNCKYRNLNFGTCKWNVTWDAFMTAYHPIRWAFSQKLPLKPKRLRLKEFLTFDDISAFVALIFKWPDNTYWHRP